MSEAYTRLRPRTGIYIYMALVQSVMRRSLTAGRQAGKRRPRLDGYLLLLLMDSRSR